MGGFIPDPYKRTVRFPVEFIDGVPRPFYGGPWPVMRQGTIGEIILPAWAFENPQQVKLFSAPLTAPILSKGEELLVGLSPSKNTDEVIRNDSGLIIPPSFGSFAKVRLDAELRLTLRGTKKASLDSCRCWIPVLKKHADSLNEAYTALSIYFEPHRRSHAGNVFRHFFFRSNEERLGKAVWQPLETKREKMEWKLEARRFQKRDGQG